jgi:hypothetical protein
MPLEKIYYWPRWFAETLSKKERLIINTGLIKKLGHGNILLWRALNLYDDILDGDKGPETLPLANSYYRRWLEIYYRLGLKPDFYKLFNRLISDLDVANRREIKRSRKYQPRLTNPLSLARKSLPLSCGPLAILASLGYKANSQRTQATLIFFRAALAAKQLSDDAYDWREDLRAGKITMANALVLRAAAKNRKRPDTLSKPAFADVLFANYASPRLRKIILNLCRQAKKHAQSAHISPGSRFVQALIGPLEKAAKMAKKSRPGRRPSP